MFIGRFESCGTKILIRRPIICQLCVGRNRAMKRINRLSIDDEFHFLTAIFFFALTVFYLSKVSKAHLEADLISATSII